MMVATRTEPMTIVGGDSGHSPLALIFAANPGRAKLPCREAGGPLQSPLAHSRDLTRGRLIHFLSRRPSPPGMHNASGPWKDWRSLECRSDRCRYAAAVEGEGGEPRMVKRPGRRSWVWALTGLV